MYNVKTLGQVFTPNHIVSQMLNMRKRFGSVLEPSAGDGAFYKNIENCVGIEIDSRYTKNGVLNIDFFDFSVENKFDTIIGNPPYVRYQDIDSNTKNKLNLKMFDERTNLYQFFIEKSINHLNDNGEIIFITPRDFLKATSSIKLNKFIYSSGTITDIIDLGDEKIFKGYSPNCIIWRFEKDNFSRKTNIHQQFTYSNGQLLFTDSLYSIYLKDIFQVKVGAVSGSDKIFESEEFGKTDFVVSSTYKSNKTKRMIYNQKIDYLEQYKDILINRKIKKFDESNWWMWGRNHFKSEKKRIYVNTKTRNKRPFFTHECKNYDGSILALFPHKDDVDLIELCDLLNDVNWFELGFVCDGRYIFSQRSLENTLLPDTFREFVNKSNMLF